MSESKSWVARTQRFCPVCGSRGAAQGIQNESRWMSCASNHQWGYEEVDNE